MSVTYGIGTVVPLNAACHVTNQSENGKVLCPLQCQNLAHAITISSPRQPSSLTLNRTYMILVLHIKPNSQMCYIIFFLGKS